MYYQDVFIINNIKYVCVLQRIDAVVQGVWWLPLGYGVQVHSVQTVRAGPAPECQVYMKRRLNFNK